MNDINSEIIGITDSIADLQLYLNLLVRYADKIKNELQPWIMADVPEPSAELEALFKALVVGFMLVKFDVMKPVPLRRVRSNLLLAPKGLHEYHRGLLLEASKNLSIVESYEEVHDRFMELLADLE